MDIVHTHCAGLDVHKKTVVACVITPKATGGWQKEIRTFETMTADLLVLSDWLQGLGVTHVAMESTGEYWKPVFNILEGNFEVVLVNAQHIKAVPGRKTDVKDAEWIADLWNIPNVPSRDCNMGWYEGVLAHPPCHLGDIPPEPQRELRELTRHRSNFIRERATVVNRVQKVLEGANIKLGSVASNVMGVSGRAILDALVAGQSDPATLAELAKGQLRSKREALTKALAGRMKPHQRFVLTELLCQIDSLDETIEHFDEQIKTYGVPFEDAVTRLDTIPGVGRATAELIVAEIGINMSQFPTARHLCAWAGVAPGNNESAGKRRHGKTRKGGRALRVGLVQAAQAAAHTRKTYLAAQYHRLAARRGRKRAILAVAHSILIIAYHLIKRQENYKELGANYFDQLNPEGTAKRLVKRLEKLGYQVALHAQPVTVTG